MLSGETATGKYPERCVEMLDKIARATEKRRPQLLRRHARRTEPARALAQRLPPRRLSGAGHRGHHASRPLGQLVASYRPSSAIIYAFTNMSTTRRKLWLLRGVIPFRMNLSKDPEKTIVNALAKLRERSVIEAGEPVVVVSDVATSTGDLVTSIQVRVSE